MKHNCCFITKSSGQAEGGHSGLDYTKMVIIQKAKYLGNEAVTVDHDEYIRIIKNVDVIKRDALDYLEQYIDHHRGITYLSSRQYRKYRYSPLKYFHKELGISSL